MKVYLDLIFFMNFYFDIILILITGKILKRNISLKRIVFSSLIGALSIFLMFFNLSQYIIVIISLIFGILMVIIAFKYINFLYTINNLLYLYMLSIVLAGIEYFFKYYFSLNNKLFLILLSPLFLYVFYSCFKDKKMNKYLDVTICFDNIKIHSVGFLDSGNFLIDPVSKKSVIIVYQKLLKGVNKIRSPVYVPVNTISGNFMMKCYKPSYILINNHKIYNYLIGSSDKHFISGIDCLLNSKLMEENYV